MNGTRVFSGVCFALIAVTAIAAAKLGALVPAPPGKIVQDKVAYLAGEAMNSRYRIVTSRVPMGTPPNDQWYLTVYAQNADRFTQVYQSPSSNDGFGLVSPLVKGNGTTRYFPYETVKIVATGEFMGPGRQQAIVQIHEAAADCGTAKIALLASQPGPGPVTVPVEVTNPCDLQVSKWSGGIVLRGPYYAANAALCCPTKARVSANLRYRNGRWTLTPNYFKLVTPRAPAPAVTPLTSASPLFTPIPKPLIGTPAPGPTHLMTPRP